MVTDDYGSELILDIHDCDASLFTRENLAEFFKHLCEFIKMERCDLHFWDYQDDPEGYAAAPVHLKGTSAIQFITTSNITIHTLDDLKRIHVNVFSYKSFDHDETRVFICSWFNGIAAHYRSVRRV